MANDAKNTIAFQGIAGAHSDLACKEAYPYMHTLACATFDDVFNSVNNGDAALGLIPIENSNAGRVAEIHNILPETNLSIVSEYFHKVEHQLLAPKGATLETINSVYSHAQAIMQSMNNIRKLGLTEVPHSDTAAAARDVANWNDPTKAALASSLAAELYGLEIIKENVQNSDKNRTLFVAISKEPTDLDPKNEQTILTSMIFTTRNLPAGLYKALGGFATNNINMLKLESYIPDYESGSAQFFMTFEGHPEQRNVQRALEELGFFTKKIKHLGTYLADPMRYKT